jgi:hypothetical protein
MSFRPIGLVGLLEGCDTRCLALGSPHGHTVPLLGPFEKGTGLGVYDTQPSEGQIEVSAPRIANSLTSVPAAGRGGSIEPLDIPILILRRSIAAIPSCPTTATCQSSGTASSTAFWAAESVWNIAIAIAAGRSDVPGIRTWTKNGIMLQRRLAPRGYGRAAGRARRGRAGCYLGIGC